MEWGMCSVCRWLTQRLLSEKSRRVKGMCSVTETAGVIREVLSERERCDRTPKRSSRSRERPAVATKGANATACSRPAPLKAVHPEETLHSIILFSSLLFFTDSWLSGDLWAFLSPQLEIVHLNFAY